VLGRKKGRATKGVEAEGSYPQARAGQEVYACMTLYMPRICLYGYAPAYAKYISAYARQARFTKSEGGKGFCSAPPYD